MSNLSTKILSYSPEVYYRFNQAHTSTPTNEGSAGSTTFSTTNETPIYQANGGIHGEGAWRFNAGGGVGDLTVSRFAVASTSNLNNTYTDVDYSLGFWFKTNYTLQNSLAHATSYNIFTAGGAPQRTWNLSIVGGVANEVAKGRLQILATGSSGARSNIRIDDQAWHYIAVTVQTSGTSQQFTLYLDGVLVGSGIPTVSSTTLTTTFGPPGNYVTSAGQNDLTTHDYSDFYVAPRSVIDATQISQIYTAGTTAGSANISITDVPSTASANMADTTQSTEVNFVAGTLNEDGEFVTPSVSTQIFINIDAPAFSIDPIGLEPTIVTTTFENVQVSTSIPVSAEIVDPLVTTDRSINVVLIDSISASADIVPGTFSQTADANIYPEAVTASADIVEPTSIISDERVTIAASAYSVSALMVDPPIIISDNSAVVYADIMTASGEIPLPSFGTPAPEPLYYQSGTLSSKILNYAIETGAVFDSYFYTASTAPNANIHTYGSLKTVEPGGVSGTGTPGTFLAEDGPFASGEKSMGILYSGTLRTTNTNFPGYLGASYTDKDYTAGIWFRLSQIPNSTSPEAIGVFRLGTSTYSATSRDFSVTITGSSHPTAPTKLALSLDGTNYDYFGQTLVFGEWHYLAVRRTGQSGVNNFEVYLDGSLQLVKTNSDTSSSYDRFFFAGTPSTAVTQGSIVIQNFHTATSATLTSYEIDQIWQAGTKFPPSVPVNAVHSADRFLATASSTAPTVIAVKGDHVEVTTSVTISAVMPEPSYSTGDNVKLNVGSLGTLEADIADNIFIETNGDKAITPEAFLASAFLPEPIISRQPAYATASLPMPQIYTAPNYFSLVMNHNPVFYIEDGQETPQNYGSWQETGWRNEYFANDVQAGLEMDTIGNQKAWMANGTFYLADPRLQPVIPDYKTKIEDLYANGNLTIELWYTSIGYGSTVNSLQYEESGVIFNDGITQIAEVWDFFGCVPGSDPLKKIVLIAERIKNYTFESANDFAVWRTFVDANPKRGLWNHLVVAYESVTDTTKIRRKVYLNGGIISNQLLTRSNSNANPSGGAFEDEGYFQDTLLQQDWTGPQLGGRIQLSGSQIIQLNQGVKVDEYAVYPKTLSATQVLEHYNFIRSRKPSTEYNATATDFAVEIGNHQFVAQQNTLYDEDPMPALAARIPEPIIIAGKSKFIFAPALDADATIIDPTITTESIQYAEAMRSNVELLLPSLSNNLYYQYVQSNIAPYRYVTFDTNDQLADYGSDADYSVNPTTINGFVTEYKDGINNRSVKTSGNSYTNGLILNESEWNDSWGTGENSYHSAFWFQRAEDDASTTGLRVLWNLNGYKDNQHVVLYQYQGKLHIQFNNGSGTWVEQDTTGLIDLFDYQQHFVVLNFNHTNPNNNIITVYVDSVVVMTVNLGSYTGTTTNAASADSGANNEANNYPRLGVGCLITPFAATALPVVPTNTKLIIDEVYWAKTAVTQERVTGLYNVMPVKIKSRNFATPITAACELVMPIISTGFTFNTTPMLAFPAQTEPSLSLEFSTNLEIESMDATADINDAVRSDSVSILAGVILLTFGLGSAGTPRVINATPLTSSIALVNRTVTGVQTGLGNAILINGQRTFDPNSKWVQYVVSTTENTLIPMREVR